MPKFVTLEASPRVRDVGADGVDRESDLHLSWRKRCTEREQESRIGHRRSLLVGRKPVDVRDRNAALL